MEDVFDIEDLKTGMRVTCKNGGVFRVYKDFVSFADKAPVDVLVREGGYNWNNLDTSEQYYGKIIKVEIPFSGMAYIEEYDSKRWKTIWELAEETQAQKDYNVAIKQLEEAEQAAKDARLAVEKLKPKK